MVRFLHLLVCAPMVMVGSLRDEDHGDGGMSPGVAAALLHETVEEVTAHSLRDGGTGHGGVPPSAATALLHETAEQVASDDEPDPLASMPPSWQDLLGPGRQVGAGSFGTVFLHDLTACPGTVAMKALNTELCSEKEIMKNEIGALLAVHHPNVMRMYDFYPRDPKSWCKRKQGKPPPMFLLEPARGGEVMGASNKYREGEDREGRRDAKLRLAMMMLVDTLRGLGALHSAGYIHRDIKPDNIFEITGDPGCVGRLGCEFVIGDLGLATQCDVVDGKRMPYSESSPGTRAFLPPETNPMAWHGLRELVVKSRWYPAGDVWALGITTLALLLNYEAKSLKKIYSVAGLRLLRLSIQAKSYLPRALLDLLLHMTQEDFETRPSAAEAAPRAEALFQELYGAPRPLRTTPEPTCLKQLADWSSTWPDPP